MPSPRFQKGNKASAGVTEGKTGRKSMYAEFIEAQWQHKSWITEEDVLKLAEKIKGGKYSVRDMYLYKALIGDPRVLAKFGDKLLPDLTLLMGPGGGAIEVDLKGEAKKRSAKYHGTP